MPDKNYIIQKYADKHGGDSGHGNTRTPVSAFQYKITANFILETSK